MRRQAQCKGLQQLELAQGQYLRNWVRPYRAPSVATVVGSSGTCSGTCNVPALREGKGSSLPNLGARGARGRSRDPSARGTGFPVGRTGPTGEDLSPHGRSAEGARHRGLAPETLGALESWYTRVVLIDSGASTNFARRQTVARNSDKFADALRESEGRGQVSVRLADGTVVNVPGVRMDLAVKFEDFDSTESFLVLDMDKYDLILGMPWLEKHEPWIDWRGKAIGASRPAVSDRALVSNVPTSVRDWGARDVLHEIDIVPGTKYCVTRQWPLPREQCEVIDAVFAEKAKSGMVRESKSPHSTPTFCVRKPNGKWRLVHAYNKLNNATVPAQTPIPRKDVLLNNMSGCTLYSALDLIDGYYQILMRESDIPLTAARTPSGMLWEWLVMLQGLSNAPATFNRLVTQFFRPLRTFTQTYVNDISVHSRAEDGETAMEVHLKHLRRMFEVMRANKLYADIDNRRDKGPRLLFQQGRRTRRSREGQGYCGLIDPEVTEGPQEVEQQHQDAFDSIKASLQQAPVLALPDENKSFSVVCDASDYAIGCALLQKDDEGHERVISFQSRQLKAAERNYPVHDKELLAMKYPLVKFR
ncbi:Pol protein, partial [Phytophthora palmivora]